MNMKQCQRTYAHAAHSWTHVEGDIVVFDVSKGTRYRCEGVLLGEHETAQPIGGDVRNVFPTVYDDGQTIANMAAMVWQDRPEALDATLADFADTVALARVMDACATITRRASAELVRRYAAPTEMKSISAPETTAKTDTCLNCAEIIELVSTPFGMRWRHAKGNRMCEPISLGTTASPIDVRQMPPALAYGATGVCERCGYAIRVSVIHTSNGRRLYWVHDGMGAERDHTASPR